MSRCSYCNAHLEKAKSGGALALTRDHVRPKCDHGWTTTPACRRCNGDKADMYLDEWLTELRASGDWRVSFVEAVAARFPHLRSRPPDSARGANAAAVRYGRDFYCAFCQRRFVGKGAAKQHAKDARHFDSEADCLDALVALDEL